MVDLPEIPRRFVTVDQIQSRITPGAVAAPYAMWANALDKFADIADTVGAEQGAKAGQNAAVTIGPDGKPSIQPAPLGNVGSYGKAYEKAALAGFGAAASNQYVVDVAALRAQAGGDPTAFKTSFDAYKDKTLAGLPQDTAARHVAEVQLDHLGAGNQADLIADKTRVDLSNSKDSINALIGRKSDEASQIARLKGVDSPEFHAAVTDLQAGYAQLSGNPLFGEPKAKTDLAYDRQVARFQGDALLGQAERLMQGGNYQGVLQLADKVDAIPNLSDSERVTLSSGIRRYAREQQSQIVAQRTALRQTADTIIKGIGLGQVDPGDLQVQDAIDQATTLGDIRTRRALFVAQNAKPFLDTLTSLPPDKRMPAFEAWRQKQLTGEDATPPATGGTPAAPAATQAPAGSSREQHGMQTLQGEGLSNVGAAGILGTLAAESRNLDPNAVNPHDGRDGSDSIGIGQWNSSRAVALKAFAASRGKPWNDLDTQLAFITHEMKTDYPQVWARLQAAKTPEEAAGIVTTGYTKPAGSQSGPGAAMYWERRREAAIRLAGGKYQPGAPEAPDVEHQMLVNAVAKGWQQYEKGDIDRQWTAAKKAFNEGVMPDQESIGALAQSIAIAGDKGKAQELSDWVDKVTAAGQMDKLTASQLEPIIASMQDAARTGGASEAGMFLMKRAEDELKEREQLRASDPVGLAERNGVVKPVAPLDWSNQQGTLEGQLRARGITASAAADFAERDAVSIFKPAEKQAFSTFLQQAPADQVLGSLGAMANTLPKETLAASMRDVAGDKTATPYVVAARFMQAGQTETAKAIVTGQRVLALNPELVGKKFETDAGPVTPTVLPPDLYAPALTNPASGQARAYSDAIETAKAIYAAGKGPQGSKDFDEALWRQSVEKAVGGFVAKEAPQDLLTQRLTGSGSFDTGMTRGTSFDRAVSGDGQKVIAPVPGMTQQEFSLRLGLVAASGLQFMDNGLGANVTPAQFFDQSKFEAVNSGRYLVRLGSGYVTDRRTGRPFVLDFNPQTPLNIGTVR